MNNTIYPSVMPFTAVARFLGLEESYSYSMTSIELLLRLINEHDIPVYLLDSLIHGVPQEFIDEECYTDEWGNIQQFDSLNFINFCYPDPQIRVIDGRLVRPIEENPHLTISTFIVDGCHFKTSDGEGILRDLPYEIDSLYIRRDDITDFKQQFENEGTISENRRSSNFSKRDERELAFRFWLATKADDKKMSADYIQPTLQECYTAIDSPTQKDVWDALRKIDQKLFAHGQDDFFKHQSLIKFKKGTGAKR